MPELYHHFLSTCSQKVRLPLAELGVEFESKLIDLIAGEQHDPEYVKLNPNHVVPTLVDGDHVLIESTLINEYVADRFGEKLRPADAADRHRMRLWTQRIDEFHPNAGAITFGIGTRPMILAQSAEQIEAGIAAIPDPQRRAARRSVIENGVKAPEVEQSLHNCRALLGDLDAALEGQDWVAGGDWSLADAAVAPYVVRLDHLGMEFLIEERPNVRAWYQRMQERASFEKAVTAWVPAPLIETFRANGEAVRADVERLLSGDA